LETFFPGILIPNHQSNTKTASDDDGDAERAEEDSSGHVSLNYESRVLIENAVRAALPGSARVSRAGFGVAPKQAFVRRISRTEGGITRKVRDGEDAIASTARRVRYPDASLRRAFCGNAERTD
jgi:hypothetical protein